MAHPDRNLIFKMVYVGDLALMEELLNGIEGYSDSITFRVNR